VGALDNAEATRLLSASLGIASYTAPTAPLRLALFTVTGSASAAGTEVTGGSYARQSLASAFGTVTNGQVTNTATVTFTAMPAATVTAAEVYDSAGSPRRAWWAALAASKTVGAGDTLSFSASALNFNANA
jgi:hypothetical protein